MGRKGRLVSNMVGGRGRRAEEEEEGDIYTVSAILQNWQQKNNMPFKKALDGLCHFQ